MCQLFSLGYMNGNRNVIKGCLNDIVLHFRHNLKLFSELFLTERQYFFFVRDFTLHYVHCILIRLFIYISHFKKIYIFLILHLNSSNAFLFFDKAFHQLQVFLISKHIQFISEKLNFLIQTITNIHLDESCLLLQRKIKYFFR